MLSAEHALSVIHTVTRIQTDMLSCLLFPMSCLSLIPPQRSLPSNLRELKGVCCFANAFLHINANWPLRLGSNQNWSSFSKWSVMPVLLVLIANTLLSDGLYRSPSMQPHCTLQKMCRKNPASTIKCALNGSVSCTDSPDTCILLLSSFLNCP